MASTQHANSSEEIAQRGKEIYDRLLRSKLEAECRGKIVAVDVDSGDYAIAESILEAAQQVSAKHPSAQVFLVQVGERAVHRFGFWKKSDSA